MKIAIDANELCAKTTYGVKVYTRNIIRSLLEIDRENEFTLYSKDNFIDEHLTHLITRHPNFHQKIIRWNKPFWTYIKFPFQIWQDKPDVLFMPIQAVPFFERSTELLKGTINEKISKKIVFFLKPQKIKIVTVIHDVAFLKFPKYFTRWDVTALKINTNRALRFSDILIVPSEATKKDIIENYGIATEKIKVVPNGYDKSAFFWHKQTLSDKQIISERYKLDKRYIIFIGVIQPRKNIHALIKSFKELVSKKSQDIELAIVGGKGWMSKEIYKDMRECGFYNRIRVMEEVNIRDLSILLRGAEAFVLPSFYEGFGLPVIEAMACGTPVVASNVSSLPEVGGNAAVYIDPYNSKTITEAVLKILQDKNWQEILRQRSLARAKDFSWEKTAKKIHKILTVDLFMDKNRNLLFGQ